MIAGLGNATDRKAPEPGDRSPAPTKEAYRRYLGAMAGPSPDRWAEATRTIFAPDAAINVCHPFNDLTGPEAYLDRFVEPLRRSFDGLYRTDYIVMGGAFEGGDWVSSTGYYCGHFQRDWLGLTATDRLMQIRFGEFHRFEDGRIVESYIFLDLPELMIAMGRWPVASVPGLNHGHTGYLPGPMTHDGLLFDPQDPEEGDKSCHMVTEMLRGLNTPDEKWRPFWHENMLWYGPAAFGSFIGVDRFHDFQVPFESAFEGWSGGSSGNGMTRHFTRFGDGAYTCSGGWPSLTGVQVKPFLDVEPTGKRIFMRVCDWWRRDGDLLVENWVFVDIPHALLQLGRDVLAEAEAMHVA